MNALVTGCSDGLGLAVTKNLISRSCHVHGVSRRKPEVDSGPRFSWHQLDLNKAAQVEALLAEKFSAQDIDLVLHCAGLGLGKLAIDTSSADFDPLMRLHVFAPLQLANFFIRKAVARDRALRLLFVSSLSAHIPFRGLLAYGASKAAPEAVGRSLAKEWKPYGIRVLSICPDYLDTAMTSALPPEVRAQIAAGSSTGRPLEVAAVAQFIVDKAMAENFDWQGESLLLSHRLGLHSRLLEPVWQEP